MSGGIPTDWVELLRWLPSAVAFVLLSGMFVRVWVLRPPPLLWPVVPLSVATAVVYTAGDVATALARTPDAYWYALVLLYTGIVAIPPTWWVLAHRLAELHGVALPTARRAALAAPAVFAAVVWLALVTNPWHGQFIEPVLGARNRYGWIWSVHTVVAYLVVAGTLAIYVRLLFASSARARRTGGFMLAATLATAAGNLAYILPGRAPLFDPTGVGMCGTALLFLIGARRSQLFALNPMAFDALLAPLPTGHLLLDANARLLRWNPAAERILDGVSVALDLDAYAALARVLRDPEHPERPLAPELLRRRLETARIALDFALLAPSGERRIVGARTTPLGDRSGVVAWSLQLEDRSALRRAEDALKQSEATLREVIDRVPALIYARDEGGRFLFANRPAAEEADLALDDLLGRSEDVLTPEDAEAGGLDREDAAVLHGGRPLVVPDRWVVDRRGRRRAFRMAKTPIRVPGDGRPAVLTVAYETTDVRHAEEALIRSQKLESLGLLAGGVAHDFNNLMAVVLGNVRLVEAGVADGSSARAALRDIADAAGRASELTGQLLAFAGAHPLRPEPLCLASEARGVLRLLAGSLPAAVTLHDELPAGGPTLQADRVQLRQVVMNLVQNACEAVAPAGGRVHLSAGASAETGTGWLAVSDSGPGIAPELRESLLDPFVSSHETGRGLGLAAVSGIVRSHGGQLEFGDAPGGGARFVVHFPRAATEAAAPEASGALPPPAAPSLRGIGRVLVVDDEPGMRRTLRRMLEATGAEVLEARDGLEALECFRAEPAAIDLVLMDLRMPRLGGREAAERMRALRPDAPIVLASGYPGDAAPRRDAEVVLLKPFTWEELCAAAQRVYGAPD